MSQKSVHHYESVLDKIISQAINAKCEVQHIKDIMFMKHEEPGKRNEAIQKTVDHKRTIMVNDLLSLIEVMTNFK